jgi:4'-phosphopantetheinyl transferase EntD
MTAPTTIFAPDTVEAMARGLFPQDVALAITFPWEAPEGLLPEEASSLCRPNDTRLREFAAGRRAVHDAMQALGLPVRPVPHGPDRAPVWPDDVVGSLSHDETICIAVLGHVRRHASLALDIEQAADLPRDLVPLVCTPAERAWLSVQPEGWRGALARLIFSAKECAYKLQYPLTRQLLEFDAFEITPDLETGQFEATLTAPVGPFAARHQLPGRFAVGAGLVLTGMALPKGE